MGVLGLASAMICITAYALILVGGIWSYIRFRFRSVPWILAFLILQSISPYFTGRFINQVFTDHNYSGNEYFLWGMNWNEFAAMLSYVSAVTATLAISLIAWFILAEMTSLYRGTASQSSPAIPAIISLPVQHSYAVGTALLLCVIAMPLFWFCMDLRSIK